LASSADTWIDSVLPNDTHGGDSNLVMRTPGNSERILINFDIAGITGKTVTSATLYFYVSDSDPGVTVFVHRLTAGFGESQATWTDAQLGQPWTIVGGDYDPHPIVSFQATGNCLVPLDVTGLVQGWAGNPLSNQGLILIVVGQSGFSTTISSKENSNGKGPILSVTTSP
jgi:hypothetical protein